MSNQEFLDSVTNGRDDVRWPLKLEATLIVGGQSKCIVEAWLSKSRRASKGEFLLKPGSKLETFPRSGAILKLKDRDEQLRLSHLQRHSPPFQNRFHFFYEVVAA
jgi:hypothetical protein